jgi:uncharacterized membrane protein
MKADRNKLQIALKEMDFEWTYRTCYHALCRYAEVARKQQISVNTVDTQVRRTKAKLRKALCILLTFSAQFSIVTGKDISL